MDAVGSPEQKVPASAFLQLLWEGGRAHEDDVVSGLQVERVSRALPPSERESDTHHLMKQGVPLIYHGYMEHGGLAGEPDLLERVDEPSALGSFAYLPVEIKSGSAYEGKKKKPKRHYLMQLCAYAELLEGLQGVLPSFGKIIDIDTEWRTLNLTDVWSEYLELRSRIHRILSGAETTRPGWKGECEHCAWQVLCLDALIGADDLTTVAGLGPAYREGLESIGITTAGDLALSKPESLLTVKGVGPNRATFWPRQAAVQKSGQPLLIQPWRAPAANFDVFYDIEDFTPDPFVYLHGFLTRPHSATKYVDPGFSEADWGSFEPVVAEPHESEKEVWERFLSKIAEFESRGEYVVYVYSHHENTNLERLKLKYGGSPELDKFVSRFADLLPIARQCVVFPTGRYGLKPLAQFVGFDWRDEDPGGAQSMAWWAEYRDNPVANAHLRDRILRYNEDDVRATLALRDWIEKFAAGRQT